MLLKDFFAYAMRKYHLPCNPTIDTTRPEVITPEMRVLSPSEMQVFIEEVMRETQRVAILTALFVGFRVGEVLALKISDLDLEKQTLSVTKNLIRVPTAAVSPENPNIEILNYDPKKKTHLIVQNTPKTSTSNREIAISDGLCELLIRHLFTLANSTWPNPDGLLFPSKAGTHLDPKSFEIRLAAVSKRCEIRKVNPHALRHTLATRLVEDKVPLNIVQGILGHSSIETTRKYLHKNEDIEREAIGILNYVPKVRIQSAADFFQHTHGHGFVPAEFCHSIGGQSGSLAQIGFAHLSVNQQLPQSVIRNGHIGNLLTTLQVYKIIISHFVRVFKILSQDRAII